MLTSAHCLDGVTAGTLQAGFLERNGRLQWYDVVKAYIPLRWKTSKALANDYAVLKLNRPPNRSYVSVSSVALPKGSVISITGEQTVAVDDFMSQMPRNEVLSSRFPFHESAKSASRGMKLFCAQFSRNETGNDRCVG